MEHFRLILALTVVLAVILVTSATETTQLPVGISGGAVISTTLADLAALNPHDPSARARARRQSATSVESVTSEQRENFLNALNQKRRSVGAADMRYVTWDTNLASDATNFTSLCSLNSTSNIYPAKSQHTIKYGAGTWDATQNYGGFSIAYWSVLNQKFDFKNLAADLQYVGCGVTLCKSFNLQGQIYLNVYMSACVFGSNVADMVLPPPSNYKTGTPCSACSSGSLWCSNGLCRDDCTVSTCDCAATCLFCGTLDKTNCRCQCKPGTSGNQCNVVSTAPGYTLPSCPGSSLCKQ